MKGRTIEIKVSFFGGRMDGKTLRKTLLSDNKYFGDLYKSFLRKK